MKLVVVLLLFIAFVATIAYYSKPNDSLVRQEVAGRITSKLGSKDAASTIGFIADGLAQLTALKSVKIEDRILFKKVGIQGVELKGIGAFGTVFFY